MNEPYSLSRRSWPREAGEASTKFKRSVMHQPWTGVKAEVPLQGP